MDANYWNKGYWKRHLEEHKSEKLDFLDDLWIKEYEDIIDSMPKGEALDLGCGLGQYTKYLFDRGFNVTSADISIEALQNLKENIPEANIMQMDMSNPFQFKDSSFEVVFANLSIHYFDEKTTIDLIKEIKRVLKNDGYFIGTVNSTKAYEFIKDHATKISDNYYFSKERTVRLWDKPQFDYFFEEFKKIKLEEVCIKRWNKRKDMWQFIYQIEK